MTTREIKTIRRLLLEGFTNCEVAKEVQCHQSTVAEWRRRMGISPVRRGRPERVYHVRRVCGNVELTGTAAECEKVIGMTHGGFLVAARRGHTKFYTIERVR